jgi:CheY-like chemotaxis protein
MKMFGNWRKETVVQSKESLPFTGDDAVASVGTDARNDASPLMGQDKKILIVDDNPVVLKAFEMKLKTLGFSVLTATEGAGAVNKVRDERPDVIVLDINFPPEASATGLQWNGFTIMQWMRRFNEASEIPVIIITSDDPAKYKERALSAGAAAFFQKPINNDEFLLTVRRLIGQNTAKDKVINN